ncbi:hypothetical protein BJY01DRAFT_228680 [Aspergillus pseudoustus]|uniref:Uncharacterized protein n=1 Tax=Aspergillus pseudoustus TaxID=1810923 RepID=A0ABR4IK23_9EURO
MHNLGARWQHSHAHAISRQIYPLSLAKMAPSKIDSPSRKHITQVQIKPLLRRVSQNGSPSTSIDLSRSSFEHSSGLGIYTSHERDSVQNDLYTNFPARRKLSDFHRRSTSGTSQLSTASSSSLGKPGSQYVHPMRLAPREYTPPLAAHSCQNSYFEHDTPESVDVLNHSTTEINDQAGRASSGPRPRLSLHIQDNSFTRLPGASQTNITGRSSFGYSRDNGSTLDTTTSPTSRSSLDFVFRSRTRTSIDPVSRAATVQAARQAFEEKEAAKTRKFEQQRIKAEERQLKKNVKEHASLRQGDAPLRQANIQETIPRTSRAPHHSGSSPNWKSQSKSTWMLFLTWLRTRVFKVRRRVKLSHK